MADTENASNDIALDDSLNPPNSANKSPLPTIIVVALITLLAILLVPDDEPKQQQKAIADKVISQQHDAQAPSLLETTPETATKATASKDAEITLPTEATASAPPAGPGDIARRYIQQLRQTQPLDLDAAYQQAQSLQAEGSLDDAYLLLFFAAREGHSPSALSLGKQSDPKHFNSNGLIDKADVSQANKWYALAVKNGSNEAETALTDLRQRVETAAAQGDAQAQRIILQWK